MLNAKGTKLRKTKLPSRFQLETGNRFWVVCVGDFSESRMWGRRGRRERSPLEQRRMRDSPFLLGCYLRKTRVWELVQEDQGRALCGRFMHGDGGNWYKTDTRGDREAISKCVLHAQAFCSSLFSKFDRQKKKNNKGPDWFCSLSLVTQLPDLPEDQATSLGCATLISKT